MDPDYVWGLKCAMKPHSQGPTSIAFRVFSENSSQNAGVRVVNYDSLDAHPELIILQGRFDKRSDKIEIPKEG
jgi:ABC-type enterochelin transport system substrate-binding protein